MHDIVKQADLPIKELLAYAQKFPEPFEAWVNFIADYDGDYFGKIWANIKDRIYFKQYANTAELRKLERILQFYFNQGSYQGFALNKTLQEYHRLKIVFSGHPNPDFDSIGTALLTIYKAFQSPYLGHARLSLSYQGKAAEYILNVIDDIVLGADRGERSFIRKLLQSRDTYQPQVKDVMTLYKDCRKITKDTELAKVIKQMEKEKLQLISVLDVADKYLGCVRIEEAYHYFYVLYQQGLLKKSTAGEAFTVAGFLNWKDIVHHKQVDPSTSLKDRDLLKQLKVAGSIPVIRQQKFQGLITRGHLDKTGVFVYMVDTQDWKTLQGVTEDMIIGYMDHHPREESVSQTLNLLSGQFESTGACVTLAAKDYLVHETVYWPKKLILVAMATLADDTDFFNLEEGKATPTDIAVYRTLIARYHAGTKGLPNSETLNKYQEKMSAYLRELISSNRQKDIARILRLSQKHKDALAGLLVDHKVDPGMKDAPFTYWIGQIKIDAANYAQWNTVDFKDWLMQKIQEDSKIHRDYRLHKSNILFFTSAERAVAKQRDELLIYTKVPEKMVLLADYIMQHMCKLSGETWSKDEIIFEKLSTHMVVLKYPAATLTSRKRQLQRIMTKALDRVYGEN